MNTLKNKVVLLTGASRGVGRGIARGLGEAGAIVYVTGRMETAAGLPEFLKKTGDVNGNQPKSQRTTLWDAAR